MKTNFSSQFFLIAFFMQSIMAGRPVFHSLSRSELIEESGLIIAGWPTVQKTMNTCSSTIGSWYVHKVLKGDKNLEGKNIMVADHQYKLLEEVQKNGKGPSYPSKIYQNNGIDKEQSTSYLFLNIDQSSCAELAAVGAQEHRFNEAEIEAMLSDDCYTIERGFESRMSKLSKKCQVEQDCKNHYFHPDSCHSPYIGNKEIGNFANSEFLALKNRYAKYCSTNWQTNAVCSPQILSMVCKKEKCEHGISELKLNASPKLNVAEISFGCAPHDALSTIILLKAKSSEYPVLSINWWGKNKLNNVVGNYQLKSKNFEESNARVDFTARYCQSKGSCFYLKEVDLLFKVLEDKNSGKVDFKIILENNLSIEGQATIEFIKSTQQILCG